MRFLRIICDDAVPENHLRAEERLAAPEQSAQALGAQCGDMREQRQRRRFGEIADARMAVAIAREEKIAAERTIRDRAGRQPQIYLIDLVLGQSLDGFGRERESLGVGEREGAAQLGHVGARRREANGRESSGAAAGDERKRGSPRNADRWPTREGRPHSLSRLVLTLSRLVLTLVSREPNAKGARRVESRLLPTAVNQICLHGIPGTPLVGPASGVQRHHCHERSRLRGGILERGIRGSAGRLDVLVKLIEELLIELVAFLGGSGFLFLNEVADQNHFRGIV
jgi:hypothetical protein